MLPHGVGLRRLIDIWVFLIEIKDGWAYVSCLRKESFSWDGCHTKKLGVIETDLEAYEVSKIWN